MIIIKNKEYLKQYSEEIKRFGINSEQHEGICLVFQNQEDETKAFNRILNIQIEEKVPFYLMASQERNPYLVSDSVPNYIG